MAGARTQASAGGDSPKRPVQAASLGCSGLFRIFLLELLLYVLQEGEGDLPSVPAPRKVCNIGELNHTNSLGLQLH